MSLYVTQDPVTFEIYDKVDFPGDIIVDNSLLILHGLISISGFVALFINVIIFNIEIIEGLLHLLVPFLLKVV